MYAFQLFARAANEPRLYAKEILALENSISLNNSNITACFFGFNKSTTEKLIFYFDFVYKDELYNIRANVVPNFLLYISINIEIQKDGNFINNESIRHEAIKTLYEALTFLV